MKKESNNKGFSLVELIIVVAIMAILMVVLAPTFTKYVDRSRQSSDASSVASIVSAMETGLADATDYPGITDGKYVVTITDGASGSSATGLTVSNSTGGATPGSSAKNDMEKAIKDACGDLAKIKRTAKKWGSNNIVITANVDKGVMSVTYEPKDFADYINKEQTSAAGGGGGTPATP